MGALQNAKEETFVQNLLKGESQRTAYRNAFPASKKWKDRTVDSKACNLANQDNILARLKELKDEAASKAVMQRQERMEVLTDIARDSAAIPKARMQAIDILNKMDGDYVKKVEAVVTTDTSEVAAKVKSILAGDGA